VTGRGSRANLMAHLLQHAFKRRRNEVRTAFEQLLKAEGPYRAPEHLAPGQQGDHGLGGALQLDAQRAEVG